MTTKEKYINPFTDFGFKKLFGTEVNKFLLIDFLNELIRERGKITDITYLRNEHLGLSAYDRRSIFDIYCENERGEKFIVEMQKAKQNYFKDRSLFYATFPIREQAVSGDWNFELKAVYTIGILDFVFDENKNDKDYLHHEVKLMEVNKKEVFYDKLTMIYLEMPKFNKHESELETHFDKWLYVLKNLPNLQQRPIRLQEKVFQNLFKVAEIAKFDKQEMSDYESSLKSYRDFKNIIDTAIEEAESKGKIEGKIEGIIEGEMKEKVKVVLTAHNEGLSFEIISKLTGLSVDEIGNIVLSIKNNS
ncbi:MAG: Rpn family recombination-promoting nuclease/putative transposase [Candidatus Kapabacteria bacterium]|jgi:predicted transposase/invertase (TIGR01784 family)|nr:Rpn family recombination-promoting nuclease/putative transposase [Candidatus Kapabacteria bacterium]